MSTPTPEDDALVARGYTQREAAFLRLVAHHGGYFIRRHYGDFIGRAHGDTTTRFLDKLVDRGDATVQTFCRSTRVLHLAPRSLYEDAGVSGEPSQRRRRPVFGITPRLMAVDFVVAHPTWTFLGTDEDRLTWCDQMGIDRVWIPEKRYGRKNGAPMSVRRFVDCGPVAVVETPSGKTLVVAHVDDAGATGVA